jgi:hypothetical protein
MLLKRCGWFIMKRELIYRNTVDVKRRKTRENSLRLKTRINSSHAGNRIFNRIFSVFWTSNHWQRIFTAPFSLFFFTQITYLSSFSIKLVQLHSGRASNLISPPLPCRCCSSQYQQPSDIGNMNDWWCLKQSWQNSKFNFSEKRWRCELAFFSCNVRWTFKIWNTLKSLCDVNDIWEVLSMLMKTQVKWKV